MGPIVDMCVVDLERQGQGQVGQRSKNCLVTIKYSSMDKLIPGIIIGWIGAKNVVTLAVEEHEYTVKTSKYFVI